MIKLKEDMNVKTLDGKEVTIIQELITVQEIINDVIKKLNN